jgi:hypothetical protein
VAISIGEPVRRSNQRVLWGLVIGVVVIGVVVGGIVAITAGGNSLGKAAREGVGNVLSYGGAQAALTAANTARSDGVGIGQITAAEVEKVDIGDRWVPGSEASAGPNSVSFSARGGHVVTAVNTAPGGFCAYGLYVSSGADPIVAADKLPTGHIFAESASNVSDCAASDAPSYGWKVVPNADFS